MIVHDNEFRLSVSIRRNILSLVSKIENATWDRFNDLSPNWKTRQNIGLLIERIERGLESLGAIQVTAHAECGDPRHQEMAKWTLSGDSGYWRYALPDGRSDAELLLNNQLSIDGRIMDAESDWLWRAHRSTSAPCPCNPKHSTKEHSVCYFYIWPKIQDTRMAEIIDVLNHIREAFNLSEDKKTRSAVREKLLISLIQIERLLAPISVDEEIEKRLG